MGRPRAPASLRLCVALTLGVFAPLLACGGEADAPPAGAGGEGSPDSITLTAYGGATLRVAAPVERIVALVPSATETLLLLGAGDRVVGRTDYDTAQAVGSLPSVGGGLQPNLEILRTLDPDVVVAFSGESDVRTVEVLAGFGIPVLPIRPSRVDDVREMIEQLGVLVGSPAEAAALIDGLDRDLAEVADVVATKPPVRFAYLLGGTPPLAAGPETFLSELAKIAGGVNVLDDLEAPYAPVSPEVLRERDIDAILMTEGSRVDDRILADRRRAGLPSWVEIPGPSLGRAAWEVARALHPDLPDRVR